MLPPLSAAPSAGTASEPARPLTAAHSVNGYNINEASRACGLSPSVLRIWELRYGWPSPKRKANGYRYYQQHQVEELRRAADLVRNGMPISALIIDGMPKWPNDEAKIPRHIPLAATKALPMAPRHDLARLQAGLIEALERHRGSQVLELVQRAAWVCRPQEEATHVLVPALTALTELRRGERPLAEAAPVKALVHNRCLQLLRQARVDKPAVRIVPHSDSDRTLAALTALLLGQRGVAAVAHLDAGLPPAGKRLVAADEPPVQLPAGALGLVGTIGDDRAPGLDQLVLRDQPLPWRL
jgi:DNA-binding transcriptional MerR regulator